ncbi:MAG: Uma2 family endonuclease [Acidobacteria bacterium]|jgi:Uma2 family endonuclease|nr:Uma2 family endonuclease [Acidobacteriota bacterium]
MTQANLAYKTEPVTAEEYLTFERAAKDKHEFIGGKIVAMAGATDRHNVIASNVFGELWTQLKGTNCRAFASDMRVNAKRGNYFYPDIVVTCGERKFEDIKKKDVLVNPTVILEVLSKSTKLKDRNEKFESYILLESLTDYVLIEQDKIKIEHYSRIDEKNWNVRIYAAAGEEIIFESIKCKLSVADVYAKG